MFGLEIPVPTALLTVIAFEGWRYFPFAFLFLMARLAAMSDEPEEAALVDGATPWQSFRFIVLPQLMPIIGLLAVLRTIWTFNEFDDIFLLTGGAAGTNVASVQIYNYLTVQRNVGQAAAQSVIMALVLVAMLSVYLLILRRRESGYERRNRYHSAESGRRRAGATPDGSWHPAPGTEPRLPGRSLGGDHRFPHRDAGAVLLHALLSVKPIGSLLQNPASLWVNLRVHSADLRGRTLLNRFRRPRLWPLSGQQWRRGARVRRAGTAHRDSGAYALARLPFIGDAM